MFPPASARQDADAPIRATDSDASLARLSAVKKGYLTDPFIAHFVPRAQSQPSRPPLINIGTTIRSESIDDLVESWMKLCILEGLKCQIVSLGAGSDTRFWRIATGSHKDLVVKYIEADFAEVTAKKAMTVKKSSTLMASLGDPSTVIIGGGGTTLSSPVYNLLPADLRKPPAEGMQAVIELLDKDVPTLLLFECVLAYISPELSSALIKHFASYFRDSAPLAGIVYEMFGLEDSFGRVMKNNLKARHVDLQGVAPYNTKASLPQRFLSLEFTMAKALTLFEIRRQYLSEEKSKSMSQVEMLDEVEELDLVLSHYAITWGIKIPEGEKFKSYREAHSPWMNWELHTIGSSKSESIDSA
ncbi:leucine carboxyl methyltransferase [Schizopora paradoxa]|uniref:Leucine carboxyl methyltransferase 1 n=1 Tax=Schizopora paradoxa TaxID=27342 RepID=A0A0H2RW69_9AGAM|nr:leucine carboxyl methyltransferase [Schizopora paradoxa]